MRFFCATPFLLSVRRVAGQKHVSSSPPSPSLYNIHSRSRKVETSRIILFYRDDAPFTASFNLEIDERAGNKQIVEKRVKRE